MGTEINISVAEMKAKLSEKIHACRELDRVFVITSHGKPRAVLISYEAYMGMTEKRTPQRKIKAKEWIQKQEVAHDIKNLFDEKKLTRKGQKGYKRRSVK
jgi:prevent-host-death family protein